MEASERLVVGRRGEVRRTDVEIASLELFEDRFPVASFVYGDVKVTPLWKAEGASDQVEGLSLYAQF